MTSIVKVNNVQDQDGNNIIKEDSNVVTIGKTSDSVVSSGITTVKGDGSSQDGKIILKLFTEFSRSWHTGTST